MAAVPMLADFAVRLAFGLFVALTLTSWRAVPVRFFRLQTQVALGILVLGALAQSRSSGSSVLLWLLVAAAAASYLATVAWGLGLPPVATVLDVLAALLAGAWIVRASQAADPSAWALMVLTRGVSGILLGATLHSMLLGHHYLVAPSMTIAPLTRSLDLIAGGPGGPLRAGRDRGMGRPRRGGRDDVERPAGGRDVPGDAMGDGHRRRGGLGLPGTPDGRDPIDPVRDGNPLHHHDLRPVRRARVVGDGGARVDRLIVSRSAMSGSAAFRRRRLSRTAGSITIDERRIRDLACGRVAGRRFGGRTGPMELTFACPGCGLVGRVAALETADRAVCRRCGTGQPLHEEAIAQSRLEACPCCLTTDLYIQKDFPQWLGLLIVTTQFAISTVFWYYEMVIATFAVLLGSALLDWACIPACPT